MISLIVLLQKKLNLHFRCQSSETRKRMRAKRFPFNCPNWNVELRRTDQIRMFQSFGLSQFRIKSTKKALSMILLLVKWNPLNVIMIYVISIYFFLFSHLSQGSFLVHAFSSNKEESIKSEGKEKLSLIILNTDFKALIYYTNVYFKTILV